MKTFVFRGKEILINASGESADIIPEEIYIEDSYIDRISGDEGIVVSDNWNPEGYTFEQLREYFACNPENIVTTATRLRAFLNWRKSTRFCPSCGTELENHPSENALICPKCHKIHYPRIEPCIIAVIKRNEEILLLRHKQRNQDIYACLAGFVEAGESLEHALRREVREETGLEIKNIKYAGSQSWPFPDQLMIGFYADYESGEIKIQEDEILEAKWFSRYDLPNCPRPGSISWRLIHFDF